MAPHPMSHAVCERACCVIHGDITSATHGDITGAIHGVTLSATHGDITSMYARRVHLFAPPRRLHCMCGRYGLAAPQRLVELPLDSLGVDEASLAFLRDVPPRWNITPSQTVRALAGDARGLRVADLRWGLIPSWSKDASIGNRLANARSDSVRSKPSFRKSFAAQRALVFADLYYEWQQVPGAKVKQPWCFRNTDNRPFAFAALWERWRGDGAEQGIETFTLITIDADSQAADVHHRMPVILPVTHYAAWLDSGTPLGDVEAMLTADAAHARHAFRVSTWVNSPSHDDAHCIEPLAP